MTELNPLTTSKYTTDILHKLGEEEHWSVEDAMFFLNGIPDADVVPKSEYEKAIEVIKEVHSLAGEVKADIPLLVKHTKEETAREIFEAFDEMMISVSAITGLTFIGCGKYAKLKKK